MRGSAYLTLYCTPLKVDAMDWTTPSCCPRTTYRGSALLQDTLPSSLSLCLSPSLVSDWGAWVPLHSLRLSRASFAPPDNHSLSAVHDPG